MTLVYAWPRVGINAMEWTEIQPIAKSNSLISGARFVTSSKRRRRVASVKVSGLKRAGAGYMEVLKEYLAGGVNLVRLRSTRNPLLEADVPDALRRRTVIDWTQGDTDYPLSWQVGAGPGPLTWVTGATLPATLVTDAGGFPAIQISGLPASTLVARVGEFVQGYQTPFVYEARRVARNSWSDAAGVAVVRVTRAFTLTPSGGANLGAEDEGVFEVDGDLPRAQQPAFAEFAYDWSFREVFADEVTGGFEERNPWL
jgi:hypothetical protein